MSTIKEAATDFLACRRIAVTGVSREPKDHGGNIVYGRLNERGYEVFPVNPNTHTVEGDHAYPDLTSSRVVSRRWWSRRAPEHALDTVREAANLGMTKVWMHRSFGAGSVSEEATRFGRQHHMVVIDGGCPLMFGPTADGGHKVMCAMLEPRARCRAPSERDGSPQVVDELRCESDVGRRRHGREPRASTSAGSPRPRTKPTSSACPIRRPRVSSFSRS